MFFGNFFNGYWIFFILLYVLFCFAILYFVVRGIIRMFKGTKEKKPIGAPGWYLQMALSKEDALSQWYWLLALAFFGVTLFSLNRNTGVYFSWHTIVAFTALVGFVLSYYYKLLYTMALSIIGAMIWWAAKATEWATEKHLQSSSVLVGLVFLNLLVLILGTLHETKQQNKRVATIYEGLGILILAFLMFILASNYGMEMFDSILRGKAFFSSWQISLSLLILFVGLLTSIFYGVYKKLLFVQEAVCIGILVILFSVIAFLPETVKIQITDYYSYSYRSGISNLTTAGVAWAMIFNLTTLLGLLSVILAGYLRKENWQINLGAVLLCLFAFNKYFDWFYTSLDKSAFFLGAGILLLVVGFFIERGRKKMLTKINV